MKQLEEAHEEKKAESNAKEVALPCEAGVGFKKRKGSSTPIERAFGVESRNQLDQEIAKMFYTEGLPFNLARNPHYLRAFQLAAANKIDGYVPPGYIKLRTTLLEKEKDNVHRQMEPLRSTWKEKAVNCFGEVKDRFFIADLMKEVINEIGHQNVVKIIIDNAANAYEQCSLIKDVHEDALAIKNFIMNHNMRGSIFSKFTPLRLLSVVDTRFASMIVMLKPIYEMISACDTDKPCLHLVYEMWVSMIEKVKIEIYKKEKHPTSQLSLFYDVVHGILVARWAKNNTPLHCLAHSLNPWYYSDAWLLEDSTRSAPHRDAEISQERMKCFQRLFPNDDEHSIVLDEYAMFSMKSGFFSDLTSISMMGTMERKIWNPNDDVKMWDVGGDAFDSMKDVGSTWKEKGVTIVSDSWSDPTRKPLINVMATSGNGPLFLKAVNCFGEVKDRFFIADLMKEVINEIGHQNVVQIITDNATNCKTTRQLIESQFPHIYWTPCVVHTLNLAVKNMCSPSNVETNALAYEQCSWIKDVHGDTLAIKNFIMNHNMRLSIFFEFTHLRLLSVADTRFASIIVMLKRLKLIKTGL
nr:hypothetical protein [Tanacetum cinerariifolium]